MPKIGVVEWKNCLQIGNSYQSQLCYLLMNMIGVLLCKNFLMNWEFQPVPVVMLFFWLQLPEFAFFLTSVVSERSPRTGMDLRSLTRLSSIQSSSRYIIEYINHSYAMPMNKQPSKVLIFNFKRWDFRSFMLHFNLKYFQFHTKLLHNLT